MQSVADINIELLRLWQRYLSGSTPVYAPMQYPEPSEDSLVFVGLNPSFSTKGWKSILRRSEIKKFEPEEFFKWVGPEDFDVELAHKLEAIAQEHYPFFASHRMLASALGMNWLHYDLFAYRETDQENVRTLFVSEQKELSLTEFGSAQFLLFEKLLSKSKPAAVIIVNALASQIYIARRSPKFNSTGGYYVDKLDDNVEFPVFLSGMLTGARALDRFSRERLFWHIAKTLGKDWRSDVQPGAPVDSPSACP